MQPYYRYPTQPQHPMQPFQVNQHMYAMNHRMPGMNPMPRQPGTVDRILGSVGSNGMAGGSNVFTMLTNVQKVLKVAETMGPMIKQYGPAMRNLPSLMTAFKDFQSGGSSIKDEVSTDPETSEKAEKKEKKQEVKEHTDLKIQEKDKKGQKEKKEASNISGPKSENIISQKSKTKTPSTTKPVPSRPLSNKPKGYHLSGPKLYV